MFKYLLLLSIFVGCTKENETKEDPVYEKKRADFEKSSAYQQIENRNLDALNDSVILGCLAMYIETKTKGDIEQEKSMLKTQPEWLSVFNSIRILLICMGHPGGGFEDLMRFFSTEVAKEGKSALLKIGVASSASIIDEAMNIYEKEIPEIEIEDLTRNTPTAKKRAYAKVDSAFLSDRPDIEKSLIHYIRISAGNIRI
jgi:hypothetical protein